MRTQSTTKSVLAISTSLSVGVLVAGSAAAPPQPAPAAQSPAVQAAPAQKPATPNPVAAPSPNPATPGSATAVTPANGMVPTLGTPLAPAAIPASGAVPVPAATIAPADQPLTASPTLEQVAPGLAGKPLTIEDAVAVALATNRTLATATESLYRAQGRTYEARAYLRPILGAGIGDVYQNSSLQPATIMAASMPWDITGLLRAATSQAQFQEVAARLDVNRAQNQVIGDVRAAFYNVLRAKALVAVTTENLQNSLDRLKDANLKYQVRSAAYFDVVRAQTDVANAQRQVIQARNGVSISTAALSNAMGIQITPSLRTSATGAVEQPPGVPPPPPSPEPRKPGAPAPPPALPPTRPAPLTLTQADLTAPDSGQVIDAALKLGPQVQPLVQEAISTRPEILNADAIIAAAKKGLKIARRSMLPTAGVSVGFYDFRTGSGTRISEPRFGLQLNIPVFDGGLEKARVQQAQGEISLATTARRDTVDQISLQVQQAYLNLLQARDQVAVANVALDTAQQAFELARTRYDSGFSPLIELSDAQAALTLAQTNQVEALYDYNQSRVNLERSVGRYSYSTGKLGYRTPPPSSVVNGPPEKPERPKK